MNTRPTVALTAAGILCPLGDSPAALHAALLAGRRAGSTADPEASLAVSVPEFDPTRYLGEANFRPLDRVGLLTAAAAALTLGEQGPRPGADAISGIVVGTYYGGLSTIAAFDRRGQEAGPLYVKPFDFANSVINAAAGQAAIWHGLSGPNATIAAGLASGLAALGCALELLRDGRADLLLAGGADAPGPEACRAFARAGRSVTDDPATAPPPTDVRRRGLVLGEGAAFLTLEPMAEVPHDQVRGELVGYGTAFDPHRGGDGGGREVALARAVQAALDDAGLPAEAVEVLAVGANGSPALDRAEAAGLARVFGSRLGEIPALVPKAGTGECLGASGALAVVELLSALASGQLPGVPGLEADPAVPLAVSPQTRPLGARVGLVTALDLDGQAAAVVVRGPEGAS